MQFSVENVGKLERKLTVKFPAERFETQVSARIAEMSRTVRLKGFRPGKVPATVIQQRFGAQVRGEVLSDLIGSTLREAFEKENLRPVANPAIDTTGKPENGEIAYTATFEVMPEFPEIDVAALEISRPVAEVADADIEKMIETLRQQRRSFDEVERASAEGDFVMFEYSAVAGDYRFPAEGLERAGSVLGSGTLFKALDAALTGRKAGEEFETDIEFPADFRNEQLAGKTAKVSFKIVKVQEPKLPEVDAEFIQLFGINDGNLDNFRTGSARQPRARAESCVDGSSEGAGRRKAGADAQRAGSAEPDGAVRSTQPRRRQRAAWPAAASAAHRCGQPGGTPARHRRPSDG